MNTPTFIMAVPFKLERKHNALYLAQQTGGTIVWDRERSIVETFTRLLETIGTSPAIILQDDIRLTNDWRTKTENVIADHPDTVCQFFSLRDSDATLGARYESGTKYLMNQAFYLPAGTAPDLLAHTLDYFKANPDSTADDLAVRSWLTKTKQEYWHHVPSLVQHKIWTSVIDKHRVWDRRSPTYIEITDDPTTGDPNAY